MRSDRPLDEQVRHRVGDDGVSWITIDRPEVANAITPDQRDRLIDLLADAGERLDVRVVVLTATGEAFCTGADLRASRPGPTRPEGAPDRAVGEVSRLIRNGAQRLVGAVLDCEKPVIAAVNGTAAGMGAHLAFACDLVIAADTARFIEVFVRRGLVPDGGGAYLLPRLIGVPKEKEMLFFGANLPAAEVATTAAAWAGRLATGPTRALALTKWLVNRSLESDRAGAFADEAQAQELNMGTADAQEGVRSFVERRRPIFRGW
ncbi:2-(1,2-epoxy-1,2-dihydrophenyl)acetyl-CoA isomerase PaaG [soil metagenome]